MIEILRADVSKNQLFRRRSQSNNKITAILQTHVKKNVWWTKAEFDLGLVKNCM